MATTCSISFQQLSSDWHVDYEDSRKADGIILLGYGDYLEYRPKLEQLIERGAHFVRWGSAVEGEVGSDRFIGQRAGRVRRRRRICCSKGGAVSRSSAPPSPAYPEFLERWRGYCRALARRRASRPTRPCASTPTRAKTAGRAAVAELLGARARFDAIFAASDVAAIGAMHALQKRSAAKSRATSRSSASTTFPPRACRARR